MGEGAVVTSCEELVNTGWVLRAGSMRKSQDGEKPACLRL